jgi:hypothetical protein
MLPDAAYKTRTRHSVLEWSRKVVAGLVCGLIASTIPGDELALAELLTQ